MKNKKFLIAIGVTVLIAGASGFFGGVQYQKSKGPTLKNFQALQDQFRSGERPQGFGERLQGQGRPISGEIIDSDEQSLTVKLPDGSSRIIFVGEKTQINKSAPATKDDLTKGTQVFVTGSENSDGSMSANSIQIGR